MKADNFLQILGQNAYEHIFTDSMSTENSIQEKVFNTYLEGRGTFGYFVLFLSPLTFTGNIIVTLSAFLVSRESRKDCSSVYVSQFFLATANILLIISVWYEIIVYERIAEEKYCDIKLGLIVSGSLTSMLSICLIALERYLYVVQGLKYDVYLTPSRTFLLIVLVWITGIAFGLTPILLTAHSVQEERLEVCEFIHTPMAVQVAAATLAVPALIITPILYSAIYCHLRKLERKMSSGCRRQPAMKVRSVLMVFFSSMSLLICWGPIIVAIIAYKFYCEVEGLPCFQLQLAIDSPLACLCFANSLLNPLIYAWWHPPYRSALGKVLCPSRPRAKSRASLRGDSADRNSAPASPFDF